ncbi:MAG TPA: hypothetical protein VKB19_04140 [Pedobacter sp.]|nr:hypothetical protein [Pedobacter sp.]
MVRRIFLTLLFTVAIAGSLFAAGKVTISGRVRAYKDFFFKTDSDQVSVTSYDPYLSVYKAKVDAGGNFTLSFPKAFTGDVEFKFADNAAIQVMVSPGDHQYYVIEPFAVKTIVNFSGNHAEINRQMSAYLKDRADVWVLKGPQKSPPTKSRFGAEPETFERKKAFLESYIKTHQLSPLFLRWAKADIDYHYASRIIQIKTSQHSSISDTVFFRQFPLDNAESLVASSYLNFLSVVRSSEIYSSPQVNTIVVYGTDINYEQVYHSLKFKDREKYDQMLKYSNLIHSVILENLSRPDSVRKYTMMQADRFAVDYMNANTSGLVKDYFFANYMLAALGLESKKAPIDYRYPMLLAAYKKSVDNRKYSKLLEEAYESFEGKHWLDAKD